MPKKRNSVKPRKTKRVLKQNEKTASIYSQLKTLTKDFPKLSLRTKSLFIFGLLFLSISFIWNFNQTIQLAFFTPNVIPTTSNAPLPTQLIITKLNLDLPIEETAINNGIWQVANDVSHLTTSARPGEKGPIILYGHNTIEILGPIRWLEKGEKIQIKTTDGKQHTYTISQTLTVSPNNMDILTKQQGEALIIYTCDGFADLQRFVIVALP